MMLSVGSHFVNNHKCRFLILLMISNLSFEVFSVVMGVYVAHIVFVVVVWMMWLQKLFGWLEELSMYFCW